MIDAKTEIELQAAVFRRLRTHLLTRTDVHNIDMMNLTGFCRNCLANWYQDAAVEKGIVLEKVEAREIIYGEPYANWQAKHQHDATPEQKAAFAAAAKAHI